MRLKPSILDRLMAPKTSGEIGRHRLGSMEAFEAALQRDLIALLNTRTAREPVPPTFREAANSLLAFGLPDLAGQNLRLASEQNRLRREIETAIRRHEPRLAGVSVTVDQWDEVKPYLRFHIEGFLKDEAGSQPVSFDTLLQSDTGRFGMQRSRQ